MHKCIFVLGGHNAGKTTLARALSSSLGYHMVGGANGADSVKNRASLYKEVVLNSHKNIVLESVFVDNKTVFEFLLSNDFELKVILLNLSHTKRTELLHNKPTRRHDTLSKDHMRTHEEAKRIYKWLQQFEGARVRCMSIDTDVSADTVYKLSLDFVQI